MDDLMENIIPITVMCVALCSCCYCCCLFIIFAYYNMSGFYQKAIGMVPGLAPTINGYNKLLGNTADAGNDMAKSGLGVGVNAASATADVTNAVTNKIRQESLNLINRPGDTIKTGWNNFTNMFK